MALRPVPADPGDDPDERGRSCPVGICDGSTWILREDGTAAPCACQERRIGQSLSRGMGSGIPRRFRGVSFDRKPICDLDPMIIRHIRGFVSDLDAQLENGRGLWFYGEVGTGKTALAMLVARTAHEAGHSVAIYSVPRLLAELRASYDAEGRGSFIALFQRLCSVDLLVLDDLGAERPSRKSPNEK